MADKIETLKINQSDYTSLMERLARYEYALEEIVNQDGLIAFLDKNEWATAEDYFSHVAKKALQLKL